MASSNRHWPSMFKSKPTCNTHQHHQWQPHDSSHRSPYTSGCEERSPEPKPRWNPKPEQIRILESIFNSGMVNPPREEIRKIRSQLQEYGQVGDANVFYWFQNRKSRSKHKNRHHQKHQSQPISAAAATTPATTSSSSSDHSSSSKSFDFLLNSPTASVNHHQPPPPQGEFLQEPYFFNVVQQPPPPPAAAAGFTQGFCFPELGNGNDDDPTVGSCSGMLLTDLMMMNHQNHEISVKNKGVGEDQRMMKMMTYSSYGAPPSPPPTSILLPPTTTVVQGLVDPRPEKSTVFINDVAFDVAVGPFNIREVFGADMALIYASGQPVVTDEWGVTLHPLQHGAFYYLVSSVAYNHATTIDLI